MDVFMGNFCFAEITGKKHENIRLVYARLQQIVHCHKHDLFFPFHHFSA
jgi:hypothetical protein